MTWIDVESPEVNEVRELMEGYNVPPLVAEELLSRTLKAKVDVYANCIYVILHFPTIEKNGHGERNQEIDFVIGKNFIISSHFSSVDALHNFSKVFEVNSILDKSDLGDHSGFIFYYMIKDIYRHLIDELESVRTSLDDAENKIFHGKEKEMVFTLSEINRDILTFREALNMHKEVLNSFEIAGRQFFGEKFAYHLRDILGEYNKVQNDVQSAKDFLEELRRTNDSLLTTKQNSVMKTLTMMAFIFLPLTFIGQVFGMSIHAMPLIDNPNGFWEVLLLMAAVAVTIFGVFKFKKWL